MWVQVQVLALYRQILQQYQRRKQYPGGQKTMKSFKKQILIFALIVTPAKIRTNSAKNIMYVHKRNRKSVSSKV